MCFRGFGSGYRVLNTSGSNHGSATPVNGRTESTASGRSLTASDRHRATVEDLLRLVLEGKSPQEARKLIAGVMQGLRN